MMTPLLDPVEQPSAPAATGDELVRAELWISFVALLRSHLGALQTTGKLAQAIFSHVNATTIELVDLSRTLHLGMLTATGEGDWSLTRMGEMIAAGAWMLHKDATVNIDSGATQDMELAVEEFAGKLWARQPAEVAAV